MRNHALILFLTGITTLTTACDKDSESRPTTSATEGLPGESTGNEPPVTTTPTTTDTPTTGATDTQTTLDATITDTATETDPGTGGFIVGTTGEEIAPCDLFDPTSCDRGEKCVGYDNTGGSSPNATKCIPLADNPAQAGELCFITPGNPDTCDKNLYCYSSTGGGEGKCLPVCTGTIEAPVCEDGATCVVANNGAIVFCSPACDPLTDNDCDDKTNPGDVCLGDVTGFFCIFPGQDPLASEGDFCMYANSCEYGTTCFNAGAGGAACKEDDPACCTAFCPLDQADVCAEGTTCVSFWEANQVPPASGYENVGVCLKEP